MSDTNVAFARLVAERDSLLQQAMTNIIDAKVIDNGMAKVDNEDERVLTDDQNRLLERALLCLDYVLNDEF